MVVKIDPGERTMRMKVDPETFYITDHYLNYPWILVRIATVDPDDLMNLLEEAWRLTAPKGLSPSTTKPPSDPRPRSAEQQSDEGDILISWRALGVLGRLKFKSSRRSIFGAR